MIISHIRILRSFVLILMLMLLRGAALACSCTPLFEFKNLSDLKPYSFIALVTITGLARENHKGGLFHVRINVHIDGRVEESFKGDKTTECVDPSYQNDCALPLKVGEQ